MNTTFARGTVATIVFTMPNGDKQEVEFSYVSKLDVTYQPMFADESVVFRQMRDTSNIAEFHIVGAIKNTVVTPAKTARPEKAPKRPTVKASASLVRKTTVKHARLAKQILDAERALISLKNEKDKTDTNLKIAREQLVASAS